MRSKKMYLAAILAAVVTFQMPLTALAEEEQIVAEEQTVEEVQTTEAEDQTLTDKAEAPLEDDGDWLINGDVTITDKSWSSTDPENQTAMDDEGNPLKAVPGWEGHTTTVEGDVASTVSEKLTDDEGNEYLQSAIDAGKGGTVNVNGDVTTKDAGAVWTDGGTVNITGDVTSSGQEAAVLVSEENGGTVNVGGDIISQNAPAVITNSKADISVKGDVAGTEGVIITLTEDGNGKVEILGEITATNTEGSALNIVTGSDDKDEILASLPTIVVGSLDTPNGEGVLWIGAEDNEDIPADGEVYEAVFKQILYYIAQDKFANAGLDVSGADTYKNGWTSNEGTELTVTVKPAEGYEVGAVSGTSVVKNPDGTYAVVVQRGKGIDLDVMIKEIVRAQQQASGNASGESSTSSAVVVIPAYAVAQKQFQTGIAEQVRALPAGGTLKIDMKDCISFNRKTFEMLAKRNDIDIEVLYTWSGKKYRVVIPAEYDILSLLDKNGYCGCLYLNAVFGATEVVNK